MILLVKGRVSLLVGGSVTVTVMRTETLLVDGCATVTEMRTESLLKGASVIL